MAFPTVIVKIINMMNGSIAGIEFNFLFVGYGSVDVGAERNLMMIDNSSDLKTVLVDADTALMTTMLAAQLNGKQNWTAGGAYLKRG